MFPFIPKKKNMRIFATVLILHVLHTKFFLSSVQENLCDGTGPPEANINFSVKFFYFALSS